MSYFVCDLGKRYYPFGEGGRRKLMRGFESLMKLRVVDDAVQPCRVEDNSTYDRLTNCPFLSIPIIAPLPGIEDEQSNGINSHDSSLLPITITDPSSPAAKVYESLAKAVITEVFKSQLSSLLVRRCCSNMSIIYAHNSTILVACCPLYCRSPLYRMSRAPAISC